MSCSKARRERQRALRKEKRREETIARKNEFGVTDLVPHSATRPDHEVILR